MLLKCHLSLFFLWKLIYYHCQDFKYAPGWTWTWTQARGDSAPGSSSECSMNSVPPQSKKSLIKLLHSELLPETLSKECSLQTAIWVDLSKMTILFKITSQNKNCLEETKLSNPKQNYIELPRIFLLYHLGIFITIF
jgi:hypothetical protein